MTGSHGVRPTRRCLGDLGADVPTADIPLHELTVPPVPAARRYRRGSPPAASRGSVLSRTVSGSSSKTGRWRGAVVRLTDDELDWPGDDPGAPVLAEQDRWWLGAAGYREEGSPQDFYEQIAARSACDRSRKPQGVDTDPLLPQEWDRKRLMLERALMQRRVYEQVMLEAGARSLRSGKVVTASFSQYEMGVLIRADRGDQYVAFIARGVFDPKVLAVMRDSFPGIAPDDWAPEPGGAFDLEPGCGEIIYSAVLPPEVAEDILDRVPWTDE